MFELFTILLIALANSFYIFGWYNAAQPDMIFYKQRQRLDKILPEWVTIPLYGCVKCMASVHGTYFYFIALWWNGNANIEHIIIWPFYIVALSGLNAILDR